MSSHVTYDELTKDVQRINAIPIIPTILDVICRTTGMGFAAVARVTEDHWVACTVNDQINFGLKAGGELKIETTICNEIRQSGMEVVINEVATDAHFSKHHTPQLYGFQSYISIPIVLKTGEFFGTLCAIDPRPAQIETPEIINMFRLFSDLIAFHLQTQTMIERSLSTLSEMNKQLETAQDENRQYRYISDHNLQEPLRKLRIFSHMLLEPKTSPDLTKELAAKINHNAQRFTLMIKDLSQFSKLNYLHSEMAPVDLNAILYNVIDVLQPDLQMKSGTITRETLPGIEAVALHMEQLFFHLLDNAIKFSRENEPPVIRITTSPVSDQEFISLALAGKASDYHVIDIVDNGRGIDPEELNKIFDIFYNSVSPQSLEGMGIGLAYCKKIVHLHGGAIRVSSRQNTGTRFSIILPHVRK